MGVMGIEVNGWVNENMVKNVNKGRVSIYFGFCDFEVVYLDVVGGEVGNFEFDLNGLFGIFVRSFYVIYVFFEVICYVIVMFVVILYIG